MQADKKSESSYRAFNFDLETKEVEKFFKSTSTAYDKIKFFLNIMVLSIDKGLVMFQKKK